jgi:hypothetical protein
MPKDMRETIALPTGQRKCLDGPGKDKVMSCRSAMSVTANGNGVVHIRKVRTNDDQQRIVRPMPPT